MAMAFKTIQLFARHYTNEIRAFLTRHQNRVQVDATTFADLLRQIRSNPQLKLPPDAGEMSVYSYVRTNVASPPGEATLILFEDDWFLWHDIRPGNVHLLSTRAFVAGLQRLASGFPAVRETGKRIRGRR